MQVLCSEFRARPGFGRGTGGINLCRCVNTKIGAVAVLLEHQGNGIAFEYGDLACGGDGGIHLVSDIGSVYIDNHFVKQLHAVMQYRELHGRVRAACVRNGINIHAYTACLGGGPVQTHSLAGVVARLHFIDGRVDVAQANSARIVGRRHTVCRHIGAVARKSNVRHNGVVLNGCGDESVNILVLIFSHCTGCQPMIAVVLGIEAECRIGAAHLSQIERGFVVHVGFGLGLLEHTARIDVAPCPSTRVGDGGVFDHVGGPLFKCLIQGVGSGNDALLDQHGIDLQNSVLGDQRLLDGEVLTVVIPTEEICGVVVYVTALMQVLCSEFRARPAIRGDGGCGACRNRREHGGGDRQHQHHDGKEEGQKFLAHGDFSL